MAESGEEQNRSEKATPYKLAKARERGVVARGPDLGFFLVLAAVASFLGAKASETGVLLAAAMRDALVGSRSSVPLTDLLGRLAWMMISPVILLPALVFAFVLAGEVMQTGPVFTTETLSLDFGRLNPARVLKKFFSPRLLIESSKQIFKAVVYTAATAFVIGSAWKAQIPAIADVNDLSSAMFASGRRMLMLVLGVSAAFAVLDQFIVRQQFAKEMRMSRREVRRELRDREGDPRLKQKRRQLHRQFSRDAKSAQNMQTADVLITNPTHYAVGLRYDPSLMSAPLVVAQGQNRSALRLRQLALLYGVQVVEDPPLARALHAKAGFERAIPESIYRQVAGIYIQLRSAGRRSAGRAS